MSTHNANRQGISLKKLAQLELLILTIAMMIVGNYLAFRVPTYQEYQGAVVLGTLIFLYQSIALTQALITSEQTAFDGLPLVGQTLFISIGITTAMGAFVAFIFLLSTT